MDLFDSLALWGRRFERQTVPGTASTTFDLANLLEMFNRSSIHELTPVANGKVMPKVLPDPVRKVKVSILDDGISAIHSGGADHFEVYRTAPTGDLAKVRVYAFSPSGAKVGEIRMLVGRRTYDQYFAEDPIFEHIGRSGAGA